MEAASSKRGGDSTTIQRETRQLQERRCNNATTNQYVVTKQEVEKQERGGAIERYQRQLADWRERGRRRLTS